MSWKKLFTGVCAAGLLIAITFEILANYDDNIMGLSSHWRSSVQKYHMIAPPVLTKVKEQAKSNSPNAKGIVSELPVDDIDGVKKFVFFIGYPRSGHSIVGSFMDAHPNMIVAHEFMLFKRWITDNHLRNKTYLFNALFMDSYKDATVGLRTKNSNSKGYSLDVGFPWQGRYEQPLLVIGDKSGGMTTFKYMENSTRFKEHYQQLLQTVTIPIKVIHVVRNPYDIISTSTLYKLGGPKFVAQQKALFQSGSNVTAQKLHSSRTLESETKKFFRMASAVTEMIEYFGSENVLEIHNCDVVMNPKLTFRKICSFLQVECPVDYLEAVENKVFKQVSKSREIVEWPIRLRQVVEKNKQDFPFFRRYSFDGNI